MTSQEVIAKLKEVNSGSSIDDVYNIVDVLIGYLSGEEDSKFFDTLQDLDSTIDALDDKALKMKLRKTFNLGEKFLRSAEDTFKKLSE